MERAKAYRIKPYSPTHMLAKLDRRTKEARLLEEVRADLIRHIGGQPTVTQRHVIERCAWLSLRVALLDRKMATGSFSPHDNREFLACSEALTKLLAKLGFKATDSRPSVPDLNEYLAKRHVERSESSDPSDLDSAHPEASHADRR
jgi:hypothetical protein